MATNNTKTIGKPTLFAFLMGALLFNLSSLPGAQTQVVGQSTDLLSTQFLSCDIDSQVRDGGVAECGDLEKNKMKGRVTVEKVQRGQNPDVQGPPAPDAPTEYVVTSEVECDICTEGARRVSRTVRNLRDVAVTAEKLFADQTSEASKERRKEKERLKRVELCLEDEEGEEITKQAKILECRIGKMNEMDTEQAADYYADNIKDEVQGLLQSQSPQDRALAMGVLAKIGKDMNINCPSRPNLQYMGNNPLTSHPALNPAMNKANSMQLSRSSDESSFVKESACDLWAFGTYNNNVEYLQLVANQPGIDRNKVSNALKTLRAGWGTYFQQRGMALQADPLGMFGMNGQLIGDLSESNLAIAKGFQDIVDRHKDLMQPLPATPGQTAEPGTGRLARGAMMPQIAQPPGTPSTSLNPWPNGQTPASPLMKPVQNPGPYTGAPKVGTPVGQ